MSINPGVPGYELAERAEVTTPAQLRAMADPLRDTILDLLLERAATVAELAGAVGRPKSTVAHHVKVLVEAGMLRVVRTRRVRAIEERYYGRTARMFYVGAMRRPDDGKTPAQASNLSVAAAESAPAHEADQLRSALRHARIPAQRAADFWLRVDALLREFAQLPRSGGTVYGFAAGLYPTDFPALPEIADEPGGRSATREAGGADRAGS
jgi:DNA-binding transcriptional ArsR family regulator